MAAPNFLSGFLQGFAQTQERQRLSKQDEDEKKARVKLYEIQLERERRANAAAQQQEDALNQIFGILGGSVPTAASSGGTSPGGPAASDLLAALAKRNNPNGAAPASIDTASPDAAQLFTALAAKNNPAGAAPASIDQMSPDAAQLFAALQAKNGNATPSPVAYGTSAGGSAKPPSLTELLSDPKMALLFLRSGMLKADDLLKQDQSAATRAMITKLMGGGGAANRMEIQGVKIGPNGEMMPDFGLPQVTSPQTVMGPNGPELATFNPRTGQRVASLGTPKPDTVTPDTAGRISGLQQAQQIAQNVMSKFITQDPSGQPKVNRQLVLTSFGRVPGTEGRKIRDDLSIAIDSVLRARTGAGVNKEEMKQVVDQFLPHPFDSDAEIMNKGQRLEQFIGGALDAVTLPPSVQKRVRSQSGGKVVDFNSLPP